MKCSKDSGQFDSYMCNNNLRMIKTFMKNHFVEKDNYFQIKI